MERELEKCRERVGQELGCGSHGYSAETKAIALAYARRRIAEGASVTAAVSYTHLTEEKEELTRLRKENRELRLEREILKKAAAFFAKENA